MKKFTLIAGALVLATTGINAQDPVFANPTLEDGSFIVKYDLANHCFASDNDFELDETFVFAIDVTGTEYETVVGQPSRNPAVLGRGMAHDFYVNNEVTGFEHFESNGNLDGRLFHIEGNIYGATFNLFQLAQGRYKDTCYGLYQVDGIDTYDALQPGAVTIFGANHFAFGWSQTNHGEEWWSAIAEPIYTLWFHTAPYTGTKTSPDFYFDDYTEGPAFEGCDSSVYTDKGYAVPEAYEAVTGVKGISADNTNAPVEYFNLQGVRVANPENGLYIVRKGTDVKKVILKK